MEGSCDASATERQGRARLTGVVDRFAKLGQAPVVSAVTWKHRESGTIDRMHAFKRNVVVPRMRIQLYSTYNENNNTSLSCSSTCLSTSNVIST